MWPSGPAGVSASCPSGGPLVTDRSSPAAGARLFDVLGSLQLAGRRRRGYLPRSSLHAESAPPATVPEPIAEAKPAGWFKRLRYRFSAASEHPSVSASGFDHTVPQHSDGISSEDQEQQEQQQQQQIRPRHNQHWMQRHMQVAGFLARAGLVSVAGIGVFTLFRCGSSFGRQLTGLLQIMCNILVHSDLVLEVPI